MIPNVKIMRKLSKIISIILYNWLEIALITTGIIAGDLLIQLVAILYKY